MRRKSIMGIVAFLALLYVTVNGQDVVQPGATPVETKQQKTDEVSDEIKEMGKLLKEVCEVLSTIQRTEGAVDKVELIREKFMHIDACATDIQGKLTAKDEEFLNPLCGEIEQELQRLGEHDCYGVEEVKGMVKGIAFFFGMDDPLPPPAKATDEQRERLSKRLTERMKEVAEDITEIATGGPGLTRESAWVMRGDTAKVVRQEYVLMKMLGLPRPPTQALVEEGGKVYDRHQLQIVGEDGGEAVFEMWFDITAYWNNPDKFKED